MIFSLCLGRGFSGDLSIVSAKIAYVFKSDRVRHLRNRKAPLIQKLLRPINAHKISIFDGRHAELLLKHASKRIYTYIAFLCILCDWQIFKIGLFKQIHSASDPRIDLAFSYRMSATSENLSKQTIHQFFFSKHRSYVFGCATQFKFCPNLC